MARPSKYSLPLSCKQWSVNCFLFHTVPLTYKAYNFLKPPVHATCPANPFLLNFVTLTLFGEHYNLLCDVVHYQL